MKVVIVFKDCEFGLTDDADHICMPKSVLASSYHNKHTEEPIEQSTNNIHQHRFSAGCG